VASYQQILHSDRRSGGGAGVQSEPETTSCGQIRTTGRRETQGFISTLRESNGGCVTVPPIPEKNQYNITVKIRYISYISEMGKINEVYKYSGKTILSRWLSAVLKI